MKALSEWAATMKSVQPFRGMGQTLKNKGLTPLREQHKNCNTKTMKQFWNRRRFFQVALLAAFTCLVIAVWRQRLQPAYGRTGSPRTTLAVLGISLVQYAHDHNNSFPRSVTGGINALRELYPRYIYAPEVLAGVGGDSKKLESALKSGESLEDYSSILYLQGFRFDDPAELAIIVDTTPIKLSSGENGYLYVRPTGDVGEVKSADWPRFFARQQELLLKNIQGPKNDDSKR